MVYCCKISRDKDVIAHAFALSSNHRKEKAEKLKNPRVRELSITAGLLLRYCLLKERIDDEKVSYSEHGKPFLKDDKLFFSLSHSGEYAACATSKKPIGIDIQKYVDIKERTAARFCTASELEYVKSCAEPDIEKIKLWTLKESYLKASGCSTAEAFAAEFDIGGDFIRGPEGYIFEIKDDIEGYIIAVCEAD